MSTKKQQIILRLIRDFKHKEGSYPTQNQLKESLGLKSVSTVNKHISELIRLGDLLQSEDQTGYELPNFRADTFTPVPVLGLITAGMPIEAIEDTAPLVVRVKNLPLRGEFYALNVRGESMIDEGIYDGDIVVIKKQNDAYDGQAVVAVIDNKATLKKLYREKKGYRLQPANQTMMPIFTEELEVRGVVWDIIKSKDSVIIKGNENMGKHKARKTLDLFAGVGGIRIGFERAGFKTVFANDFEKSCKLTYDLNFNCSSLFVEDITKIKTDELPAFDFLLGGFPCQAFSIAGYRKGFEDEKGRGNLFLDIARIIKAHKPEGFLLENVKNLKTHDGGNTFKVIQETLEALGYHLKYKVLNTMEYGNVPQNRERIYIVGFRDRSKIDKFEFPEKINLSVKVTDLLEQQVDKKYYYNGKPLYERLKNDVNETGSVYQWRRQYVRKNMKSVCPTLTANMGMGGHNVPIIYDGKGIRKLTPRECFRLQGFPDSYILPKNIADSALYKQAGNSVSVPVLERIAKQIQGVI